MSIQEKISALPPALPPKSSADPASFVKSAQSTPLATTRPSTPLQLSVAAPNDTDEHIYDAVDNYTAIATAANLQMASPNSEAGTLPSTDEPQSDLVAVDYYEELPAPANQQRLCPDSMAATPCISEQYPLEENIPTCMK